MDARVTRGEQATPALKITERAPRPPVQARSIERRRKLLAAGRRVFASRGFEAASIGEITRRAGAASGAFYIYFSSKRQFLVSLMNEFLAGLGRLDLRQVLSHDTRGGETGRGRSKGPRAALRTFLAAAFLVDRENFGVVRAWREAALADRELGRLERSIQSWTEARILRVFRLFQKHPRARSVCDLPAFAQMMDRHFWSLLARGSQISKREFDREVQLSADIIYAYLFESDANGPI